MDPTGGLAQIAAAVRACEKCRLHRTRTKAVPGEGPPGARLFLIGEAPGRREDETGRPFVGAAGRLLTEFLEGAGAPRKEVFITSVVKCRPPENRTPRADEIHTCHPYLAAQIAWVRPRAIVTMGATALRGLLGPGVELQAARRHRRRYQGIPVFATYHPAAVLYNRRLATVLARDLARAKRFTETTEAARTDRAASGATGRIERSAGCVLANAEGQVLLLRRADEGIWCLPKGHVDPGETDEQAAVREAREETGLGSEILERLPEIHYSFHRPRDSRNVVKTVQYFLATVVGGRLRLEAGFDEARWCDRSDALRRLHYDNDRRVVRAGFDALTRRRP